MVLCGICNDDYTKCDAQGGILVGSYAICPACSLEFDETEDEPIISADFRSAKSTHIPNGQPQHF